MGNHDGVASATQLAFRCAQQRLRLVKMHRGRLRNSEGTPVGDETQALWRFQSDMVAAADLYLADVDMSHLLEVAGETMALQPLLETDPISETGVLFFADPLPRPQNPSFLNEPRLRALAWARLPAGDPLLNPDGDNALLVIPYFPQILINTEAKTLRYDHDSTAAQEFLAAVWPFGGTDSYEHNGPESRAALGKGHEPGEWDLYYQRLLAAFWTIAREPIITVVNEESPGRPVDQRRARRAGVREPSSPVRVIRLRHRDPGLSTPVSPSPVEPGDSSKRVYRHRWAVRGHWRNTWYPSLQAHRQQWIQPQIRGNPDAPLLHGEKVFLLQPDPPPREP